MTRHEMEVAKVLLDDRAEDYERISDIAHMIEDARSEAEHDIAGRICSFLKNNKAQPELADEVWAIFGASP